MSYWRFHIFQGVYQHVTGNYIGSHAVKILGWGYENGTAYWLAANSWNVNWGDDGKVANLCHCVILYKFLGFFKVLRGKDEVGIEDNVYAGIPKY